MQTKKILNTDRVRRIAGGFSFIPHRFLIDGFLASLEQKELLLYLFLVLASDRYGLSCYSYDAICTLLSINIDEYMAARRGLIGKDLISFDGRIFQVLDLPPRPVLTKKPSKYEDDCDCEDNHGSGDENPVEIARLIKESLREADIRRGVRHD